MMSETRAAPLQVSQERVRAFRLQRHHLLERKACGSLADLAQDLCGVQAQLLSAAHLALWTRVQGLSRQDIDRALVHDRSLVKTWCMRGTLHLLPASELPLYLAALRTAAQASLERFLADRALTRTQYFSLCETIQSALSAGALTRRRLATEVSLHAGEQFRPLVEESWGGLLRHMCRLGLVVFGPACGQHVTFVLRKRWLGDAPTDTQDTQSAASALFLRFLQAYGPATVQDFSFWTGLKAADAHAAAGQARRHTQVISVAGQPRLICSADLHQLQTSIPEENSIRLLPSFDSYLLAHRDKAQLLAPEHYKRVFRSAGWVSPTVLVNGLVAGVWSYRKGKEITVEISLFQPIERVMHQRLGEEIALLESFFGGPVRVIYS